MNKMVIIISKSSLPLIIRADANPEIGTGHVMRCLALAEAWQDTGGEVSYVSAFYAQALEVRLKREGIQIQHTYEKVGTRGDADETARIAQEHGADWIVVDGYRFGAGYQKAIKDSGLSLLFVDDYGHADHYYADIVLNQNIYADIYFYPKYEPYTQFLLGTKYALIRKEFLKLSSLHRDIPDIARKILVTFGGSDPNNVTLKIVEALKKINVNKIDVIVIIGGANPYFNLIHEIVKDLPNFTLIKNAENMPELMAWADIAISAGGSTCWELAFMGLPSILCPIAKNQKIITQELFKIHASVGFPLGKLTSTKDVAHFIDSFLNNKKLRTDFSRTQKKIVDGAGAKNIVSIMIGNN
jgi:UDP-2,4-diacetamido-2,4,6-trideoxy-beta-L-altropyranose hydrolase